MDLKRVANYREQHGLIAGTRKTGNRFGSALQVGGSETSGKRKVVQLGNTLHALSKKRVSPERYANQIGDEKAPSDSRRREGE